MELFEQLASKVYDKNKVLVFPEGEDVRIQGAAIRLLADHLVRPILLGNREEIKSVAQSEGYDLTGIEIIDPTEYPKMEYEKMINALVERRNGKIDVVMATKMLQDVNYFGTMLVYLHKADGMVSGAIHPTGDTVRPALQIIKTIPGSKRISGSFVMQRDEERYIFADAAINIDIDAKTMAEIAIQSAQTARIFGIDPKVAMLSFSTKGSATAEQVNKVVEAVEIAHTMSPNLPLDGELQFDAAFVESVALSKAPASKVAGHANVFIFPDLQSGNIGYKIAQRLGGFEAIGPILQGLAAPVSDLSRGANEEDVYKTAIITAAQAVDGN